MGAKERVGKQLGECGSNGCKGNCGLTLRVVWATKLLRECGLTIGVVWFTWV
jgi:hypothetical protein